MTHFHMVATTSGSGKTTSAVNVAVEESIKFGFATCICQPTRVLIDATVKELRERHPTFDKIKVFHCDTWRQGTTVAGDVMEFLKTTLPQDGWVLFITQTTLFNLNYWHHRDHWNLVVDEAPDPHHSENFQLGTHRNLLLDKVFVEAVPESVLPPRIKKGKTDESDKWLYLRGNENAREWCDARKNDNMVDRHFQTVGRMLVPGSGWEVFVHNVTWDTFRLGVQPSLQAHARLTPGFFVGFRQVTFMSANFADTMIYKSFVRQGVEFSVNRKIEAGLRYRQHTNGSRLTIKYLTDATWAKAKRKRVVACSRPASSETEAGLPVATMTLIDLYRQAIEREFAGHKYLWLRNLDLSVEALSGKLLPGNPCGLNHYQDYTRCAILCALNATPHQAKWLHEIEGICDVTYRRAKLSQIGYQAMGRGCLRNPDSVEHFTLIVPDAQTAHDIARYYTGCHVAMLLDFDPIPPGKQRGRKPVYKNGAERVAAFRARAKQGQRDINEVCNDLLTKVSPHEGFAMTEFAAVNKPQASAHHHHMSTNQFFLRLAEAAQIKRKSKQDNTVFSPAIFDTDYRRKAHVLGQLGTVLDFDYTQIAPERFPLIFPELEMILYASAGHNDQDTKYRVCIPNSAYTTAENAAIIRAMMLQRIIEATGFADEKQHGLDIRKSRDHAAIFYMPSSHPHSFLSHYHGPHRKAIDPDQWLEQAPLELLEREYTTATPKAPVVAPQAPQEIGCAQRSYYPETAQPNRNDNWVARAIALWRESQLQRGVGNVQFFVLANRLRRAGLDSMEIGQVLSEECMHARSPCERRNEIAGLMRKVG